INLQDGSVEQYLAAQGHGFGDGNGSHATAVGMYETAGINGGSTEPGGALYLRGMDDSNTNAERRAVELHGARYVDENTGHVGHSWGCVAVDDDDAPHIIKELNGGKGSALLIYHTPMPVVRGAS